MATASDILSAIAPEFDDSPARATMLDMAETNTHSTNFGTVRPQAVAYRAAHYLCEFNGAAIAASGGVSGAVNSKKEGDLQVGFGAASSGSQGYTSALSSTPFGRMLLELMRSTFAAVRVTGVPFVMSSRLGGRYQ